MKKVSQLINANGNANANQFIIYNDGALGFQSYDSLVCVYDEKTNVITFGVDWNYSRTTMKHLNTFLNDYVGCYLKGKENITKAIKKGSYNNYIIKYDNNLCM